MQCPKCSGPLEEVDLDAINAGYEYYVACGDSTCTEWYDAVVECFKCDECDIHIYIGEESV